MKYDPQKHHRRSIRLKGYDYTQPGAYFLTICTYQRAEIFGEIINGEMELSALGKIVSEEWLRSAEIRKEIQVFEDELMIMPNHLHGINWIVDTTIGPNGIRPDHVGADSIRPNEGFRPDKGVRPDIERAHAMRPNIILPKPQKTDAGRASLRLRRVPRSLGSFIAGFKASVTSRAGRELNMTGIWQRNYYEHIIRNDRELNNIRWYILNNPLNWQLDRDNHQNIRKLSPPENVEEYVKDVAEMVLKRKADSG